MEKTVRIHDCRTETNGKVVWFTREISEREAKRLEAEGQEAAERAAYAAECRMHNL